MMKKLFALLVALLFMSNVFAEKDVDKDGKVTVKEFAGDDKKLKRAFKSWIKTKLLQKKNLMLSLSIKRKKAKRRRKTLQRNNLLH